MSLIKEILENLLEAKLLYKGNPVNIFGLPKLKKRSRDSIYVALSRMKKSGLLDKDLQGWLVTPTGREYLKRKHDSLRQFEFKFEKAAPRNLIVMFDIPEERKAEREWLRFQLKKGRYVMIQKSVWIGPSPLPKEFLTYLKELRLEQMIRTFKLARNYALK